MAYQIKKEPSSNAVNQAEFSRIIGVKPSTVWEFKRDDKLVIEYTGGHDRVLVKESIEKLNAEMSMHKKFAADSGETEIEDDVSQLSLDSKNAQELYNNAKALKEKALALQADVDYKKAIGDLVERDVVEKIIFERARQFRDGVSATSKRLAPLIVGKDSLKEVEILINDELRYMLDQFSKLPVVE